MNSSRLKVTSIAVKQHLLEFARRQHEDFRFGGAGGKQIAKGVKFAHEVIQQTPMLADAGMYLDVLEKLLVEERNRIRGSSDDDPEGRVLKGMQAVISEVRAERQINLT